MLRYKKILIFFLVICIVLLVSVCAFAEENITVQINGKNLSFTTPPQNVQGCVMAPMDPIFRALGVQVSQIETQQGIIAVKGSRSISMQVGSKKLLIVDVGSQKPKIGAITLDVPPTVIEGKVFVPAQAVLKSLGLYVIWDEATQTIAASETGMPVVTDFDSGSCRDSLTWFFDKITGALTIQGEGTMTNYTSGTTPWKKYQNNIKTIHIDNAVTSIGENAFSICSGLKSVTVGNNVASIEKEAFSGCYNLKEINLPDSLECIEENAFNNCNGLRDVYFREDAATWDRITIKSGNDYLIGATIHCISLTITGLKTNVYFTHEIENGSIIVIGYYNEKGILVDMDFCNAEKKVIATPPEEYIEAKVMWWRNIENIVPICDSKKI